MSSLPRQIAPDVHWFGDCLKVDDGGQPVHGHMSCFLILGERTLMVDSGHPSHWSVIESQLDALLGDRTLDYVFPTHLELPHTGNTPRLAQKYPECQIVGDVRDYHLYFPDLEHRLVHRRAGSELDLGDRTFSFIDAPLRDIPNTLWGHDDLSKIMFVADGFAYMHQHEADQCALYSTEYPEKLDPQRTVFVNEKALYWTKFIDVNPVFDRVKELLSLYETDTVAPAHGGLIPDVDEMLPIIEEGLNLIRSNTD